MGYRIIFDFGAVERAFKNPKSRTFAHERLYAYCDKYTPCRSGHLSEDVVRNEYGVHYKAPYSVYVYFGNFNFRKDRHPDATGKWDRVMLVNEGDAYLAEVRRYGLQQL